MKFNPERDPVVNVIYEGIKNPIKLCAENQMERAALILMYAAIDALTTLGLPEDKSSSSRNDYAAWCDKYLVFNSEHKVNGMEWFAARSGLLHNYAAESNMSRDGEVRMLSYYGGDGPDIIYRPEKSKDLVLIKTNRLFEVFFEALDRFVVDLYVNINHKIIDTRFTKMFHNLVEDEKSSNN